MTLTTAFRRCLPLVAVAALLLVAAPVGAAGPPIETINAEESITLDPLGDATITMAFSMTATQFTNWQQKYGQNKSLLKRDLGKLVSQYDTHDWDIQVNDMERRITLKVQAHGSVRYRGGGQYELDILPSWRGGDVHGNTVGYNYVESVGVGVVAQHNVKVILPTDARDVTQTTSESGQPVLRYTVKVPHRGPLLLLLVPGVTAMLLGAIFIAFALLRRQGAQGGATRRAPVPLIDVPATSAAGPH